VELGGARRWEAFKAWSCGKGLPPTPCPGGEPKSLDDHPTADKSGKDLSLDRLPPPCLSATGVIRRSRGGKLGIACASTVGSVQEGGFTLSNRTNTTRETSLGEKGEKGGGKRSYGYGQYLGRKGADRKGGEKKDVLWSFHKITGGV